MLHPRRHGHRVGDTGSVSRQSFSTQPGDDTGVVDWKDTIVMKISTILDHIDSGHMALPEFQRGYVWNRDQVRSLFDSLYRRHPVGACWFGPPKPELLPIAAMAHWRQG